jgi:hypothetical protein
MASSSEVMSFEQFQQAMIARAKAILGEHYKADEGMDAYYLQESWRENYDNGRTPEESVESDMSYWED